MTTPSAITRACDAPRRCSDCGEWMVYARAEGYWCDLCPPVLDFGGDAT